MEVPITENSEDDVSSDGAAEVVIDGGSDDDVTSEVSRTEQKFETSSQLSIGLADELRSCAASRTGATFIRPVVVYPNDLLCCTRMPLDQFMTSYPDCVIKREESADVVLLSLQDPRCNTLDHILPPKIQYDDEGHGTVRRASKIKSRRADVVALTEQFELNLLDFNARTLGLCKTRRKIYNDLFDEIIRGITVECRERGLLLWKVRQEAMSTIHVLQTMQEATENLKQDDCARLAAAKTQHECRILEIKAEMRELEREYNGLKHRIEISNAGSMSRRENSKSQHGVNTQQEKEYICQIKRFTMTVEDFQDGPRSLMRLDDLSLGRQSTRTEA